MKARRLKVEARNQIWIDLGELLWQYRKQCGFSQKQVASTRIVSQSDLSKIENGKMTIDIITLAELGGVYKVDLIELLPKRLVKLNSILTNSLHDG